MTGVRDERGAADAPEGEAPSAKPVRFVVLAHDHPMPHWDFLVEDGGVLRSWRLSAWPTLGTVVAAEEIAPHRRIYLDYEGPVSGGRGSVQRVSGGWCLIVQQDDGVIRLHILDSELAGEFWWRRVTDAQWEFHWKSPEDLAEQGDAKT